MSICYRLRIPQCMDMGFFHAKSINKRNNIPLRTTYRVFKRMNNSVSLQHRSGALIVQKIWTKRFKEDDSTVTKLSKNIKW